MFVIMHWIGMNCSGKNGIFPTRFCSIYIKSVLCFIFGLSTSHVAMSRRLFLPVYFHVRAYTYLSFIVYIFIIFTILYTIHR